MNVVYHKMILHRPTLFNNNLINNITKNPRNIQIALKLRCDPSAFPVVFPFVVNQHKHNSLREFLGEDRSKGQGMCLCCAAPGPRFQPQKNVPGDGISKKLGCSHPGKTPFGLQRPSRGCRARVLRSPPPLAGDSQGQEGLGGPRRAAPRRLGAAKPEGGQGEPAAPSRCLRLQRRAEPCRHRGEGAEVPDTPRGAEGTDSLAPCLGNRPGHIVRPLAGEAPNVE